MCFGPMFAATPASWSRKRLPYGWSEFSRRARSAWRSFWRKRTARNRSGWIGALDYRAEALYFLSSLAKPEPLIQPADAEFLASRATEAPIVRVKRCVQNRRLLLSSWTRIRRALRQVAKSSCRGAAHVRNRLLLWL